MAQRVQIPISGITTSPVYEDGSACSLVNLHPKNGALRPIPPRKIEQELSQEYDIVFVHQNNNYENWLGVKVGETSFIYGNILSGSDDLIAEIPNAVNSVQQIGNTISLVCNDTVYYLLYKNGAYTFLGELPQTPVISFGTTEMVEQEMLFTEEYKSGSITTSNFVEATKGLVNKAMDAMVNGWTNNRGEYIPGQGEFLFDTCFVRYAFRLFDGTLTKHSPPILVMPREHLYPANNMMTVHFGFTDGKLKNTSYVTIKGYKLNMFYGFPQLEQWKDIIQSVDIFLSAPLGVSNIENMRDDLGSLDVLWDGLWGDFVHLPLITSISNEVFDRISETSIFYHIRSIDLGDTSSWEGESLPNPDKDTGALSNLIFQDVMTNDNFSQHRYGAARSYAYNNRLHLVNIKTALFNGFTSEYFHWATRYNGMEPVDFNTDQVVIEVTINTGVSIEKVYSFSRPDITFFSSAFFSYPDARATQMNIYRISADGFWRHLFSSNLQAHKFLNLAYYLQPDLMRIPYSSPSGGRIVPTPTISPVVSIIEPNKIKVSELNNPLHFPNVNTYQVGGGTILALSTNRMNVSDRNYGQHPLYVFTTKGIWTLNVGSGDVVYSTLSAPTSLETPVSDIVGETPYGVIFATQRGLMIINGQEVVFISSALERRPQALNIEMNAKCAGVVFPPEHRSLTDILNNLSHLVYNPFENEVIINTKGEGLNYVYDFDSRSFYRSTEEFDVVAQNKYPELYVIQGKSLKNYALIQSPVAHVGLITRPLQFTTPDIKNLERIILRALFYEVKNPDSSKFSLSMLHYSNDGINFLASRGVPIKEGNHKDIDMGIIARGKSRYFMYTFAGVVNQQSEIHHLDCVVDKEYDNPKMR